MAYTTALLVERYLGGGLTSDELVQAHALIPAAEAFVNDTCHRQFGLGVQSNEAHYGPFIADLFLTYPPVTVVTSVTGRTSLGATETTLTVDVDYEVRDLAAGRLWLASPGSYDRLRVTYTPDTAIPAAVQLAATELVALALQTTRQPDAYGLRRYRLPDLEVEYAREMVAQAATPATLERLAAYRHLVIA